MLYGGEQNTRMAASLPLTGASLPAGVPGHVGVLIAACPLLLHHFITFPKEAPT